MLCLRAEACVIMSVAISSFKKNPKPTWDDAKAYGSMINYVFPTLQMSVNAKNCS